MRTALPGPAGDPRRAGWVGTTPAQRVGVAALALLLQGLAILVLRAPVDGRVPGPAPVAPLVLPIRLFPSAPPAGAKPAAAPPRNPGAPQPAAPGTPAPARPRPGPSAAAPATRPRDEPVAADAIMLPPVTPPAQTAAAGPAAASTPSGSILDTEATRRAIREAARQPLLGERAQQASGLPEPLSEQQRLAETIARQAHGDCLKGEYAGGGMGLLSLPFWLAAELRQKCSR